MKDCFVGVVDSYGTRPESRHGFLNIEGQPKSQVFRFEDGRCVVERDGEVAWSDARIMREPQKGDRIVFGTDSSGTRPMVMIWGFADDLEELEERIRRHLAA